MVLRVVENMYEHYEEDEDDTESSRCNNKKSYREFLEGSIKPNKNSQDQELVNFYEVYKSEEMDEEEIEIFERYLLEKPIFDMRKLLNNKKKL